MVRIRRALVVDDEAALRFVVSQALKEKGWRVDVVDDGDLVEESLRETHYDLVVLDLMMPGKNGFEVLRQLRRGDTAHWKTAADVRVVALSGKAGEEGLEFAQRIGANSVLSKPFDLDQLWQAIEESD